MNKKLSKSSVITTGSMNMPVVGLGTWQSQTERDVEIAINTAIDAGYRHIDTAFVYMNEIIIGNVIKNLISSGKVKREKLFILPNIANREEHVERYLRQSLNNLQLSYVDLYLIHHPVGLLHNENNYLPFNDKGELQLDMTTDLISLWKGMEKLYDSGLAKSIGVSNFNLRQMKKLVENCRICPVNLQIELNVYCQQVDLRKFCKDNEIVISAYAPFGSPALSNFTESVGKKSKRKPDSYPLQDSVVQKIAIKYGKLPSHILLRFLLQLGVAVIPKSVNQERIYQNIELFDFEINENDMEILKSLDKGPDGRLFIEGIFEGCHLHPEFPI